MVALGVEQTGTALLAPLVEQETPHQFLHPKETMGVLEEAAQMRFQAVEAVLLLLELTVIPLHRQQLPEEMEVTELLLLLVDHP
jgi:hypothetical protein